MKVEKERKSFSQADVECGNCDSWNVPKEHPLAYKVWLRMHFGF